MIIAISTLFKELFVQQGINELVAQATGEAVRSVIESFQSVGQELASQRLNVIDIESDTWYAFHLANESSWRRGLRTWADVLKEEFPRRYLFSQNRGSPGGAGLPFNSTVRATDQGLVLQVKKARGTSQVIDRDAVRRAFMSAVGDTVKAYIRCVAAAGDDFPGDFKRA